MAQRGWLDAAASEVATCLAFFSRLPLPSGLFRADRPFGEAIRCLPVASLLIGACGAVPLAAAGALGLPPLAAAIIAVAAGLFATGALHEDGLADVADGFGGGTSRLRKLEIMRDSRIGTYGVLALGTSLLWRVVALAALLERAGTAGACATMLGVAAVSRALSLVPLASLPPARTDGLGRGVGPIGSGALASCFGLALILGVGVPAVAGIGIGHALLACGGAALASGGVTRMADRQIGGQTGDVAGACQQAAEAAYLLGLLLLPPIGG